MHARRFDNFRDKDVSRINATPRDPSHPRDGFHRAGARVFALVSPTATRSIFPSCGRNTPTTNKLYGKRARSKLISLSSGTCRRRYLIDEAPMSNGRR